MKPFNYVAIVISVCVILVLNETNAGNINVYQQSINFCMKSVCIKDHSHISTFVKNLFHMS